MAWPTCERRHLKIHRMRVSDAGLTQQVCKSCDETFATHRRRYINADDFQRAAPHHLKCDVEYNE
jgi:hypothetical protein